MYKKQIVKEYSEYNGSISDAINIFLSLNTNYMVKSISLSQSVVSNGIFAFAIVLYEEI
jgi:hypothetical protein